MSDGISRWACPKCGHEAASTTCSPEVLQRDHRCERTTQMYRIVDGPGGPECGAVPPIVWGFDHPCNRRLWHEGKHRALAPWYPIQEVEWG